jgi:hypothetical protein
MEWIYGLIPLVVGIVPMLYATIVSSKARGTSPTTTGIYRASLGWLLFLPIAALASVIYWIIGFVFLAPHGSTLGTMIFPILLATGWFALLGLGTAELVTLRLEISDNDVILRRFFRTKRIARSEIQRVWIFN